MRLTVLYNLPLESKYNKPTRDFWRIPLFYFFVHFPNFNFHVTFFLFFLFFFKRVNENFVSANQEKSWTNERCLFFIEIYRACFDV